VIHEQLVYSIIEGFRPLLLDLHVPAGTGDGVRPPVVMWIHGGAFRNGDRRWLPGTLPPDSIFDRLLDAGLACASIDYRLSGEATWPAQGDDVRAAIDFLRATGSEYGVDPARLGTWGESAGGHLALMGGLITPHVSAMVAWYPVTDIVAGVAETGDDSESPWLGGRPSTMPELIADASPITHVTSAAPPCLFVHGDADEVVPVSQSVRMHARLTEVGVESTLRIVPGADHCFEGYDDIPALIDGSVAYLRANL
jgi:acetyl esterase/lipase